MREGRRGETRRDRPVLAEESGQHGDRQQRHEDSDKGVRKRDPLDEDAFEDRGIGVDSGEVGLQGAHGAGDRRPRGAE